MKKNIVLLSLFLFTSINLFAQFIFEENYGNAQNKEKTNSIIQHDGVVVLAGYTTLQTNGGDDILLIKLDTIGNLIWKKNIGGSKNEQANKIRLLSDGYLIAGHTKSIGNGNQDFYLIKTDFDGNILWERSYGTSNLENCVDIIITADNGFMMLGTAVTSPTNGEDWWVVKTDNEGNEEWSNYYGAEKRDRPAILKSLSDGNYLISGGFDLDIKIFKIDINGTAIWDYSSSGGFWGARDILELDNNDLLVSQFPGTIKRLTSEGEELYSQDHVSPFGLALSSLSYKFLPITEDSILILNQRYSFAINPETGDTLADLSWDTNTSEFYDQWNDLLIVNDQFFVAADRWVDPDPDLLHHIGISMKKFTSDRVQTNTYIDTFELNTYKEYSKKVIETTSGDFVLFGERNYFGYSSYSDKILLTHTTTDGEFISELTFNKGFYAKPIDILYSDLGNFILLTQINTDTMELSMVDPDGLTLWAQYFSGNFDDEGSGKIGIIKKYLNDQYLLLLDSEQFYFFEEDGTINASYQSNLSGTLPLDISILPNGQILHITERRMRLLESDASTISLTSLIPIGYSNADYFDFVFKSEEEIWLTGKTNISGVDSSQYVIMKINIDGQQLFTSVFDLWHEEEIPRLNLLSVDQDILLVYSNQENPWNYLFNIYEPNAARINCLTKPLHTAFIEKLNTEGDVLHRLDFGVGQGANIFDMIYTTDGDIVGTGWVYDTNSDDQYLVKIGQEFSLPTTELDLKNKGTSLVYPNPGNATIHFSLETEYTGRLQINLFDARGHLVYTQQADKTNDQINIELDTKHLTNGVYFLQSMVDGIPMSIDRWIKFQLN